MLGIVFKVPKYFNSLSSEIQNASSIAVFASKLTWYQQTLLLLMLVCSFSLLLLFSCIIFSSFFFFIFVLAGSALPVFVLFNAYFLWCKEIVCASLINCLADASILVVN